MATTTREQFLDTAEALFAARGFYGTSIAAIADELGLTKQALLHHFGSKEKLYGDVLRRISDQFEALRPETEAAAEEPAVHLKAYLMQIFQTASNGSNQTRLLMRELLDNNERAETAGEWFLKPFLNNLVTMVTAIPNWQDASKAEALAMVYQILGAINYFGISAPTLTGIFGKTAHARFEQAFPPQLERLFEAAISARQ
ncbi:MAG: helix-turn-helix domain-containing protein [Pseudomonadota bacterium]